MSEPVFDVEGYVAWVMSDDYTVDADPLLCACLSCSMTHQFDFEQDPAKWRAEQIEAARS